MWLDAVGFTGVDDSVDVQELAELSARYPWIEWGVLLRPDRQGQPRYAGPKLLERFGQAVALGGNGLGAGSSGGAVRAASAEASSGNQGGSIAASRLARVCAQICAGDCLKAAPLAADGAPPQAPSALRLAAHLCGGDCLKVLKGDVDHVLQLRRIIGFRRVQLNPTAANAAGGWEPRAAAKGVRAVAAALPDIEFILQWNDETLPLGRELFQDPAYSPPPNLAVLLDASCGAGVVPAKHASPPGGGAVHCGYAGGLSPETVSDQLRAIAAACKGHSGTVWIDMESGVRSKLADGRDIFDLARVRQVIAQVEAAGVLAR